MSVASVGSSNGQSAVLAAQQAARTHYLKTGVDKDAALGDPDHDAQRKVTPKAAPTVSAPTSKATASAATTVNAAPPAPSKSHAAAAAAYAAATPVR